MMFKNLSNKTKIIFKKKSRIFLNKITNNKNILIICSNRGKNQILNDKKITFSKKTKISWISNVTSNPSLQYLENINKIYTNKKYDFVIGFGGGSAIDVAKVIFFSFFVKKKNIKDIIDKKYFVKKNKNLTKLIAVPTTSGTGSEVTPFATVWDKKNKKKLSVSNNFTYPHIAIVDPDLTNTLSMNETINTALDSLNQAFESIWNKNCTKKTYFLACKSIQLTLQALKCLVKNKNLKKVRYKLSKSSLLAGICISQTRTSICHSISYPLTSHFGTPHGLACSFTMLQVIKYINKKNNFFFLKLIRYLRLKNFKELIKILKYIFVKTEVKRKNILYFKNKKNILSLVNKMQTKDRSDNFIFPVNEKLIKQIILKSI